MGKYISLSDIYTNTVVLQEDVELFAQELGEEAPKSIGTVEDSYYNVIRRQVIAKQKGGTADIVHNILNQCRWDSGKKVEYEQKVLIPVLDIINNTTDVDIEKFKEFSEAKETFDWLGTEIAGGQPFNIKNGCMNVMSRFFSNPQAAYEYIYNHNFAIQTVAVGKGELVMSMFSNASKGVRGDLDVPGIGEVEIKGENGRPGKGKNALNAIKELPKFLETHAGRNIYSGKEIRKKRDYIFQSYDGSISSLINYATLGIEKAESLNKDASILHNVIDIANNIVKNVVYDNNFELTSETLSELQLLIPTADIIRKGVGQRIQKFIDAINNYEEALISANPEEYSSSWGDTVRNTFMVPWGLSKESYIEGLLYLINEDLPPSMVSSYKDALNTILTPDVLAAILANDSRGDLKAIIGTLHTVSYQFIHKFPVLMFTNEKSFNVFPILFKSEDPYINFINVYNIYTKNPFRLTLALDSQFAAGIPITYLG